jgi:hypothetical protein
VSVYRIAAVSGLALALAGCGPKPPELYPLSGTITRDGAAVTAGGLIFLPEPHDGSGRVVNAAVNADGTFAARTEVTGSDGRMTAQPGVPAGRYKVVYHPPGDGQKVGADVELSERVTVEARANTAALVLPPKPVGEPRADAGAKAGP